MAITSTATPKDNRWHALRLRWDAVDRRTERWLLLTFYALIILTIAVEVIPPLCPQLLLGVGRRAGPLCLHLSCLAGRSGGGA